MAELMLNLVNNLLNKINKMNLCPLMQFMFPFLIDIAHILPIISSWH